ncbi:MAG TPA: hypothetical protein VF114_05225 [Candidatus Limnocylindria bacterium]
MSLCRRLGLAVLLAVAGHQLALAAGDLAAPGAGLRAADHGPAWGFAVVLVVAGAVLATGLAAWRILALRLHLRVAPALSLPSGGALLPTWVTLTLMAVAFFLAQENVEHLTQHGHLPLLEPLFSGQYAAVLPVFAGLGLLLAAAGLAIGTTLQRLKHAIRATRGRRQPPPRRVGTWRALLHDRRRLTRMVTALSPRRGPPLPTIG